jgi:hypothetical protein
MKISAMIKATTMRQASTSFSKMSGGVLPAASTGKPPLSATAFMSGRLLTQVMARLDQLEAKAADARPAAVDGELARAEFHNAIAMARHATRRAFGVMTGQMNRAALAAELRAIMDRHSDLWLARNRPGGLPESLDRLRDALRPLEG